MKRTKKCPPVGIPVLFNVYCLHQQHGGLYTDEPVTVYIVNFSSFRGAGTFKMTGIITRLTFQNHDYTAHVNILTSDAKIILSRAFELECTEKTTLTSESIKSWTPVSNLLLYTGEKYKSDLFIKLISQGETT